MGKEQPIFRLLWDLVNEVENHDGYGPGNNTGTIISRYADIIEDRLNNSGYSRSVDSLKLYTDKQLQDELEGRRDTSLPNSGKHNPSKDK